MTRLSFLFVVVLLSSTQSHAWGGRGHHAICSVAVHLVTDEKLKDFLKTRPHTMGHLCNVPDIYWKSLPRTVAGPGDAAHFLDPEVTGIKIHEIPLDFRKLETDFTGQEDKFKPGSTIRSFADDFGSVWWRVDQFMRRIGLQKTAFEKSAAPKERREEQDEKLPFNQEVYSLMVDMGLMGHFVGDAGQPFHNTADYDGYGSGHGGIHSYYEEAVVAQADADLEAEIAKAARKMGKESFLDSKKSVLERMRALSTISAGDRHALLVKDPIKVKSESRKEKGMDIRKAAERESPQTGWKRFGPSITKQMGRSARLLAQLWDEAYVSAGRPDLKAYRSYRYPFTPDFVPLDYASPPAPKAKE